MSRKSLKLALLCALLCATLCATSPHSALAQTSPQKSAKLTQSEIDEMVYQGKAYLSGEFIGKQDYAKALDLFGRAAKAGDAEGTYMLATMIYEGQGVIRSEKEAFRLYAIAAEKGHTDSEMLTGTQHLYLAMRQKPDSEARQKEYAAAAKWFKRAAAKKQPEAMVWYGDMMVRGMGGVKQEKQAGLRLIEQAAEKHNYNAHAVLAGYYIDGDQFPVNHEKAYMRLILSRDGGNKNAILGMKMLEEKTTPELRAKAEEAAKAWQQKHPAPATPPAL